MATINTYEVHCLSPERVLVHGSFRPQAAGALVAADTAPTTRAGFSVARAGVGAYTVTFTEAWPDMDACFVSARKSDGTAMVCQGGDYSAANKTLQIRTLVAGAGSALVRTIPLDISSARAYTATKSIFIEDLRVGSTPPTLDSVLFGWAFDADAEAIRCEAAVPEDWDGASNMTLRLHWHASATIDDTETMKWQVTWGTIDAGEAADNGTEVVSATTYTQSGAGTAKEYFQTDLTIDFDDAGQPIAKGDLLTFLIQLDASNSTGVSVGSNDGVLVKVELRYTALDQPLTVNDSFSSGPYISRVNGTTDPSRRIVWPAGDVTPVQLPAFLWPSTLDGTENATIRLRAASSSTNDTPTIDCQFWESQGDTEAGAATAALSDTTANVTATVTAANISDTPTGLPVTLTLVPGTHNTDDVWVYGAEVTFTATDTPGALALADLSDDVDNRVSFLCIMKNTASGAAAT